MDVEAEPKDLSNKRFGVDESLETSDGRDERFGNQIFFKDESVLARFGKRQQLRVSPRIRSAGSVSLRHTSLCPPTNTRVVERLWSRLNDRPYQHFDDYVGGDNIVSRL